jgi:hypothetical protein
MLSSTAPEPLVPTVPPETEATVGQEAIHHTHPVDKLPSGQDGREEVTADPDASIEVQERSFQKPRTPGKGRGRRLVKPEDRQRPAFTPEQRLLILESWQPSGLVEAASEHGQYLDMLHGQLDFERSRNEKLCAEIQGLQQELADLRLELKVERQRRFICGSPDSEAGDEVAIQDNFTAVPSKGTHTRPLHMNLLAADADVALLMAIPRCCPAFSPPLIRPSAKLLDFILQQLHGHLPADLHGEQIQGILHQLDDFLLVEAKLDRPTTFITCSPPFGPLRFPLSLLAATTALAVSCTHWRLLLC